MLNITNHQRSANQNYSEVSPHTGQNGHHQKIYKQENKRVDTKGGKAAEGGGGAVMNWEIGTDIYTLTCIKWVTNKSLLYKKINKILKIIFKKSKKILW